MNPLPADLDSLRAKALKQLDQSQQVVKYSIVAMALFEAICLFGLLSLADIRDRNHQLLLCAVGLIYMPLAMGLLALGAHVNRCTLRVLTRLDDMQR